MMLNRFVENDKCFCLYLNLNFVYFLLVRKVTSSNDDLSFVMNHAFYGAVIYSIFLL